LAITGARTPGTLVSIPSPSYSAVEECAPRTQQPSAPWSWATSMRNEPESVVLPQAEVSFGLVLLPDERFRREVGAASDAVTAKMPNQNIVDEGRFPAHLSLYLGGTTAAGVDMLASGLENLAGDAPRAIDVTRLSQGNRGFLSAEVAKTPALRAFAGAIIAHCRAIHHVNPVYRPHLIGRWDRLSPERQDLLREFGTYKTVDAWDPHISVASVQEADLSEAAALAGAVLVLPQTVPVAALQLVDVGHDNERWRVLRSFPVLD
jgi:hypothetical protein